MSSIDQIPPGCYSNIDTFIVSKRGRGGNNISINHNNIIRRKNQPVNRSLANFTGEVPSFGVILGTVAEKRSMKDQFKTFQDKVEKYLRKFDNSIYITIVFWYLKDPYIHVDMDNPIKHSKEDSYRRR